MLCITIIWVTAGTCKPTVSQSKQFTTYLWEKQFKFIHLVFRHCQLLPLHHKLQLHQDPTVQKYTTSSCHTNTSLPSYPALTLCLQRRGSVFVNENAKRITDRRRIKEALFFCFFFKITWAVCDTDPGAASASHWHPLIVVWELRERAREWNGWLGFGECNGLHLQTLQTWDSDRRPRAANTHGSKSAFGVTLKTETNLI